MKKSLESHGTPLPGDQKCISCPRELLSGPLLAKIFRSVAVRWWNRRFFSHLPVPGFPPKKIAQFRLTHFPTHFPAHFRQTHFRPIFADPFSPPFSPDRRSDPRSPSSAHPAELAICGPGLSSNSKGTDETPPALLPFRKFFLPLNDVSRCWSSALSSCRDSGAQPARLRSNWDIGRQTGLAVDGYG